MNPGNQTYDLIYDEINSFLDINYPNNVPFTTSKEEVEENIKQGVWTILDKHLDKQAELPTPIVKIDEKNIIHISLKW